MRVVHGLQSSWEPVIATVHHERFRGVTAWSPCNRFIAVGRPGVVDIRDAVTLMLLNTLKSSSRPECLRFSPDGRILTQIDHDKPTVVTWDLQTGGSVHTTFPSNLGENPYVLSSTYSTDWKTLAVVYSDFPTKTTFVATHDLSTTRTHLYRVPEGRVLRPIWNHSECLRFATMKRGSITIWQVEFTLNHPPEMVESFPAPHEIADAHEYAEFLFLPSLSRLAMPLFNRVFLWDVRYSKLLLKANFDARWLSFSSDGRFFACASLETREVHVWKESPTGYVLHQKIATVNPDTPSWLSPNGESILISPLSKIHLQHTKDPILPSRPTLNTDLLNFKLGFSPNEISAAFAREDGKTVTILDLQSGYPKLATGTDIGVRGLGMTGSAIVVVGEDVVGTWRLTAGEASGAKLISIIVRVKTLDSSPPSRFQHPAIFWSVSPDLGRIVVSGYGDQCQSTGLEIYDVSTGRCLEGVTSSTGALKSLFLRVDSGH